MPVDELVKNASEILDIEDSEIEKLQENSDIKYDETQISDIKSALKSKFSVITGGPGTGKTTITKVIIEIFKKRELKVLLTAPIGRAAKRMNEAAKIEAKTIHRLLDASPKKGYKKNAENPLEGDTLIIDETSMVDLISMYNLMKAVPDAMKVILIGDVDQISSVGAGNVLSDIIELEAVQVVKLTHIYCQAKKSKIITKAHKINTGDMPDLSGGNDSDFFFIPRRIIGKSSELNFKFMFEVVA